MQDELSEDTNFEINNLNVISDHKHPRDHPCPECRPDERHVRYIFNYLCYYLCIYRLGV